MALKPTLNVKQSQSLTLTPLLMQSIKMLQLSHLEINALVESELEQNPLLTRDENNSIETPDVSSPEDNIINIDNIASASDIAQNFDTEVDNIFPEQVGQDSISQSTSLSSQSTSPLLSNNISASEAPNIDAYVAAKPSLSEHLWEQAILMFEIPSERMIARFLINSLDGAGYLSTDIISIAEQLGSKESHILDILYRLQECEPTGVFCRDVKECLSIQLKALDRLDPMMKSLLDNLDMVMNHDLISLGKKINASDEDITDMLKELRELNPKPAQDFADLQVQAVAPDVFVKQGNDGSWLIELNSEILPKVLINQTYFAQVKQKLRQAEEKSYLSDCLQNANWLTKSLDQRAKTILKVASEIVKQQNDFLIYGISHLKPMTLKMVADAIEMHESTVSRVTSNKYIATQRGMFEMKYFFTRALASSSGEGDHSAQSVRHIIKQLIDNEELSAILSDENIAKILQNQHGIDIARRTVMKYRESLHLASSVIRRRQKKAQKDL